MPVIILCILSNRKMWVTWNDGTITLGRKTVNANHIASVTDPYGARQYTSLHLSALDSQSPVYWEFDIDAGTHLTYLRRLVPLKLKFSNFLIFLIYICYLSTHIDCKKLNLKQGSECNVISLFSIQILRKMSFYVFLHN